MKKIIDLIRQKIKKCDELCFCSYQYKKEGLLTDQKKCGNCHSKDILDELLDEIHKL